MRSSQSSQRSLKEDSIPRRLQCDQCVYTTKNISDLRRHERRHNDVKYPCDVCNMPFMTLGHLGGHKRSAHSIDVARQSSERRRVCGQCDYTTAHASDMAKHKRKHEVNEYHCPTCNYPFGHETTLKVHISKYHDNQDLGDGHSITAKTDKNQQQHDVGSCIKSSSGSENDVRNNHNLEKRHPIKHLSKRPNDVKQLRQHDSCSDHESSRRNENLDNCGDNPDRYEPRTTTCRPDVPSNKNATECTVNRIETSKDLHNSPLGARMNHDLKCHRNQSTGDHRLRHGMSAVKEILSRDLGLPGDDCSRVLNSSMSQQRGAIDDDDDFENPNSQHIVKVTSCKHCAFRTSDLAAFRRHNDRHSKGQFRCSICRMPFLFKTNLDRHLESKHSNSAESSDSSFETSTNNSHERLKCSLCPFITFSYKQLDTHSKQHDADVEKDSVCQIVDDTNHNVNAPEECYSFEDNDPDLQFILDIDNDLKTKGSPKKDKLCLMNVEPVGKADQTKILADKQRMRGVDNKETANGVWRSKDNGAIDGVGGSNLNRPDSVVPVEEYTCIKCNYVTFDKRFMNLHTTMHGYLFRSPKKLNCKASTDSTSLGYKTGVVHLSKDKLPISDQKNARYFKTLFDVVNSSKCSSEHITDGTTPANVKDAVTECPSVLSKGIVDYIRSSSVKFMSGTSQRGNFDAKIASANDRDYSKKVVEELSGTTITLNESNSRQTKDAKPTLNSSTNSRAITNLKESVTNSVQQVDTNQTCNSVSTSPHSVTSSNLLGCVTKEEFKRSRTFYKVDQMAGFPVYECKICEKENKFLSKTELYRHFKRLHEKIRRQICSTCKYCSGPFPKLD